MLKFFIYPFCVIFFVGCVTPKIHNTLMEEYSSVQNKLIEKEQELLTLEKESKEL